MTTGPNKDLKEHFGKRKTTLMENLEWLVERKEGLFLVRPFRKHSNNKHTVGVDCTRRLIF